MALLAGLKWRNWVPDWRAVSAVCSPISGGGRVRRSGCLNASGGASERRQDARGNEALAWADLILCQKWSGSGSIRASAPVVMICLTE